MPRDGSGIFTQPFPDVVTGTTIESSVHNGTIDDFVTDANTPRPIVAGGTGSGTVAGAQTNLQILPTTGGTMTGNLTVNKDTPTITLNKTAAAQHNLLAGQSAGVLRWNISLGDAVAETGSNAGSNFSLLRYSDAGAFIDQPLYIMRSTGNVGIGMASPTRKLEVAGIIGVTEGVTNTGVVLKNTAAGGRDFQLLSCATGGVVNGGFVLFDNTAPASRLAIDASGNVGIGTTGPTNRLTVQAAGPADPALADGTGYAVFFASGGYSHMQFGGMANSPYAGWIQSTNGSIATAMLLNPLGGNVGIGTASPSAKLHVEGATQTNMLHATSGAVYTYGWGGTAATGIVFFGSSGTKYLSGDGANFAFNGMPVLVQAGTASSSYTNGALVVTGGVGVSNHLHVAGNVNAAAFILTSGPGLPYIISDVANNLIHRCGGTHYFQNSGGDITYATFASGVATFSTAVNVGASVVSGAALDIAAAGSSNPVIRYFIGGTLLWNLYPQYTDGRFNFLDADASAGVTLGQNENAWAAYSDGRMRRKQNARSVEGLLDRLAQFRLIEYGEDYRHIGVIAQELEGFLPQLVLRGDDADRIIDRVDVEGVWSVRPSEAAWAALQCVKELLERVRALETRH